MTPNAVIQDTTARYTARASHRRDNEERLRTGSPLIADTPARVQKRLAHLATTGMATVAATAASARERGSVAAAAPSVAAATIGLERILGTNELMSVTFLERAVQVARTVGRVQIRSSAGALREYGTGFTSRISRKRCATRAARPTATGSSLVRPRGR